jgi:T5SS/PEP-CTERM-associated repeat protein
MLRRAGSLPVDSIRPRSARADLPAYAIALAAAAAVLSSAARADVVVERGGFPGQLSVFASASVGDGVPASEDRKDATPPPNFTAFSVPLLAANASRSGRNGSSVNSSTGSVDASFDVAGGVFTFDSSASMLSDATFTPSGNPVDNTGGGFGDATLSLNLGLALTNRSYEYNFSWTSDHDVTVRSGGNRSKSQVQLSSSGTDLINLLDLHRNEAGGGAVNAAGNGVLAPGNYALSLSGETSAGSGPQLPGPSRAAESFTFQLTLTPAGRWINTAGGSFQGPTNWAAQAIPGPDEAAIFDVPGTYTVSLDQSVSNKVADVNGSGTNVTFDLNGHNYTVGQLNIGGRPGDGGTVTIKDSGGIVVSAASPSSPAAAAAPLPLTLFKATSMAVRGNQTVEITAATSSSHVLIDEGATVSAAGATALWTINDVLVGKGTISLSNEAAVTSTSADIGTGPSFVPDAVANVTVAGSGTGWTTDNLAVGSTGKGNLNVLREGGLSFQRLTVGRDVGSTGTVTVDGSINVNQPGAGQSVIGDHGNGSLKVLNNAEVQAIHGTLTVGSSSQGAGDVLVLDGGRLLVGSLNVGPAGTATLAVGQRSKVSIAPAGLPGTAVVGTHGAISVNANGTFSSDHFLQVDGTFTVDATSGLAIVGDDPGTFGRGKLFVSSNGTLSGTGTIFGRLVLAGGAIGFTGHVQPGHSPGTLTIAGDFEQQAGGVLDIQIAGTTPGAFDVLSIRGDAGAGVAGNATIGGDLSLEFLDGFAPRAGDRFDFLTATGSLTGQFEHVEVLNLAPGFQFDLRNEGGHLAMVALNDAVSVPEPAASGLLILSVLALPRRRRHARP